MNVTHTDENLDLDDLERMVPNGIYLPATLLLGCWSRADISQMQGLHQRFAAGQPLLFGRLLSWCGARAERRP